MATTTLFRRLGFPLVLLLASALHAQPGSLDLTFNANENDTYGYGTSMVSLAQVLPTGKILIGGGFSTYNRFPIKGIARINIDGSLDQSFDPGPDAAIIRSFAVQPDDRIIVVGAFVSWGSSSSSCIARLNSNGTLDTSFNAGSGFFGTMMGTGPYTVALQPDGKILVGGRFSSFDGVPRPYLARLETTGALDTTFIPSSSLGDIYGVTVQPDGRILTTGAFPEGIRRLEANGSLDTSFNCGTGADGSVYCAAVLPDGDILIGGFFDTVDGTLRNNMARLNSDGSHDVGFDPGSAFNWNLYQILPLPGGKLYVAAAEDPLYDTTPGTAIARLNGDGSIDPSFDVGDGLGSPYDATRLHTIAIQPDSSLIIGGVFDSYDRIPVDRIARLLPSGAIDLSFNPATGINDLPETIAQQPDGKLVIAGDFTGYDRVLRRGIARIHEDGSLDTTFQTGWGFSDTDVRAIELLPNGKLMAGGSFSRYDTTIRHHIARLNPDGSLDTSFMADLGWTGDVRTLAVAPDGKCVVAGSFTEVNGIASNGLARLNNDGSRDVSFNLSCNGACGIQSLWRQPDGKFIVSGWFTQLQGTSRNRIARLNANGSLDLSFAPGSGFLDGYVYSMALQSDGRMLLAGSFQSYDGITAGGIVRLNTDGSIDPSFNAGSGANVTIACMALQADERIVIGGYFDSYNGAPAWRLARLNSDGSLDPSFQCGLAINEPIAPPSIHSLAVQSDQKILIGGLFTTYDNHPRRFFARLNNDFTTTTGNTALLRTAVVFPNPTPGVFTLSTPISGPFTMSVTDVAGRTVLEQRFAENGITQRTVDLTGHPSGLYMLQLRTIEGLLTGKVVKE